MKTPFHRVQDIPAHAINGIAVALGIACIQLVIGAIGGSHAAQLALSGAVCASLADVPNTPARTAQRVGAAALLGWVAATLTFVLAPWPLALGGGVALISFAAMMSMAWGARAGAVSFAPILALVFTVAVPRGSTPLHVLALWNAAGGAAYLLWALLAGALLQRRYRALALAQVLRAAATLLQTRAALMRVAGGDGSAPMQAWVRGEADLAERLQTARDFVFAQPDGADARRQTAIVLRAIELRDVLLASRLDIELLGDDDAGRWVRNLAAGGLDATAGALHAAALAARRQRAPCRAAADAGTHATDATDAATLLHTAPLAPGDARWRLLPLLAERLRQFDAEVQAVVALQRGGVAALPLSRAELQRFVAPEGWPLAALRAQWHGQSPVLRHAVRAALALSSAYFIALALPWASHPHWLVLSVAVVLRGSLEQTLARRNARVLGTVLGCAVVVGLSYTPSSGLLSLVFLLAVGTAHAFVLQRYWLTASAATVMALLQAHMVHPAGGFAIPERVADTLLGAALAWAFSYVLPAWERRSLPNAVARVLKELKDYAALALRFEPADAVEQRLARRRAYDALAALGSALQRSSAEPKAVRLPVAQVAALLDHGQRLMAHLSLVRMTLSNRRQQFAPADAPAAAQALLDAGSALGRCLDLRDAGGAALPPDPQPALAGVPAQAPADNILPWLLRRLALLVQDGRNIRAAAAAALGQPR